MFISPPISNLTKGQRYVYSPDGTSQYVQGGPSTCGLAALNASRIILGREEQGTTGAALLESLVTRSSLEVWNIPIVS